MNSHRGVCLVQADRIHGHRKAEDLIKFGRVHWEKREKVSPPGESIVETKECETTLEVASHFDLGDCGEIIVGGVGRLESFVDKESQMDITALFFQKRETPGLSQFARLTLSYCKLMTSLLFLRRKGF